ncbi:MAG: hypothetical protein R3B48_07360 [Kofleriaceae bacterium]
MAFASNRLIAARRSGGPGGAATAVLEAESGWRIELPGAPGPLAARGPRLLATAQRTDDELSALWIDADTGEITARLALRATEFVIAVDVAACDGAAAIAGAFAGTLRVGDREVSSGGLRDGFVATLDAAGQVASLVRLGGAGDDGLTAVGCRGDAVAIAGTFGPGAELRGATLPRVAERSGASDAVVALLRAGGVVWQRSFGGAAEDLPLDLTFTDAGELAVVGVARGELALGGVTHQVAGPADGYLARWSLEGELIGSLRLGGPDYDAATRVAALGDTLFVTGFFSGTVDLDGVVLRAQGGDDAMLVIVTPGSPTRAAPISGAGREEVVSLVPAGRALALGVAHTAGLSALGLAAPPPADPLGGAAALLVPSW